MMRKGPERWLVANDVCGGVDEVICAGVVQMQVQHLALARQVSVFTSNVLWRIAIVWKTQSTLHAKLGIDPRERGSIDGGFSGTVPVENCPERVFDMPACQSVASQTLHLF
jgi:hypothetical protein